MDRCYHLHVTGGCTPGWRRSWTAQLRVRCAPSGSPCLPALGPAYPSDPPPDPTHGSHLSSCIGGEDPQRDNRRSQAVLTLNYGSRWSFAVSLANTWCAPNAFLWRLCMTMSQPMSSAYLFAPCLQLCLVVPSVNSAVWQTLHACTA